MFDKVLANLQAFDGLQRYFSMMLGPHIVRHTTHNVHSVYAIQCTASRNGQNDKRPE